MIKELREKVESSFAKAMADKLVERIFQVLQVLQVEKGRYKAIE